MLVLETVAVGSLTPAGCEQCREHVSRKHKDCRKAVVNCVGGCLAAGPLAQAYCGRNL